jgi:hypothetical protein
MPRRIVFAEPGLRKEHDQYQSTLGRSPPRIVPEQDADRDPGDGGSETVLAKTFGVKLEHIEITVRA